MGAGGVLKRVKKRGCLTLSVEQGKGAVPIDVGMVQCPFLLVRGMGQCLLISRGPREYPSFLCLSCLVLSRLYGRGVQGPGAQRAGCVGGGGAEWAQPPRVRAPARSPPLCPPYGACP